MKSFNRERPDPLNVPKTRRVHALSGMTSLPAGKMVPIAAVPLLRHDAARGACQLSVEMGETHELLMNPVYMRVMAYVVPWLAFERFEGSRDQFDRSWMGEPQVLDGDPVPFVETAAMGTHGSKAVYKYLGLHAHPDRQVNTMYAEAYNLIWNYRARNRSPSLTERARLDYTLAPAFWPQSRFQNIVPTFDQAAIDGEVSLNVIAGQLAVRTNVGGTSGPIVRRTNAANWEVFDAGGNVLTGTGAIQSNGGALANALGGGVSLDPKDQIVADLTNIVAEMTENGITVSLSNIELAKKTQAFAKVRERYAEHSEDWVIDMLMNGWAIPDQHLKDPILIADQVVRVRQTKRYATDAENLAESAVSGGAVSSVRLRVPELDVGGIIMIVGECVPEPIYERQADPLFHASNNRTQGDELDDFPAFLRDYLDPEKVDVVRNGDIDTDHSADTDTFGYEPMNSKWGRYGPRIGGKFYRPDVDGTADVERQRVWAVEVADPALGPEWYLVPDLDLDPVFLNTEDDPFEVVYGGGVVIEGITQFGRMLVESDDNYDAVADKAPNNPRIDTGA